ncbi:MAG: SLATT domain-containing protein [bacterium]|nr:SLATT domain-containing protein [bacterium]
MKSEDLEKQNDLLYRDVDRHIKYVKDKMLKHRWRYRVSKLAIFFFGALITLLTGWQVLDGCADIENCFFAQENIVLFLSTSISLIVTIEGFFSFRDKAVAYRIFLFELRRLRDKITYEYDKSPEAYYEKRDEFFAEYDKILENQRTIIEESFEE